MIAREAHALQDSPQAVGVAEMPPVHVIATWCNAGEHRSVGISEMIRAVAKELGMQVIGDSHIDKVWHLCNTRWWRRGCGCCAECDPFQESPIRDEAQGSFEEEVGQAAARSLA